MPTKPVPAAVAAAGLPTPASSPLGSGTAGPLAGTGTAGRAWAGLCGLTAVVHLGGLYLSRELRAQLNAELGLWLVAGLVWLLALGALRQATPLIPRSRAERRALGLLWTVALLMRIPAVALPVGHSDDVYRYLWDGAVQAAGHSPYAGPPDDPEYAAVRATHPELHGRINHRHLPTIYPPAAQLLFRLHAAVTPRPQTAARPLARSATESHPIQPTDDTIELATSASSGRALPVQSPAELASAVRLWKVLVVGADLLILALLVALCRARGRDVRWAMVWGVAPLPAVELSYNGHLESLGILPLMLALWLGQRWGWARWGSRGRAAEPGGVTDGAMPATVMGAIGALMAAAVLVKPVAAAVLPALLRLPRRAFLWLVGGALLAALLLVGPYGRRGALPPSLGEYGRRWRSNDGAYAGLLVVTKVAVDRLYRPPYYEPWRRPALARLITGRDRDTVWPDELAGALARGGILLALGALTVVGVRRRGSPLVLGLGLLLGYQLLTPVLHPWYELWPLALAALVPPLVLPVVLMAALAPLAHLPLADYFAGRGFHEAVWPRLMQHGAGWAALGAMAWTCRRRARPLSAENQGRD